MYLEGDTLQKLLDMEKNETERQDVIKMYKCLVECK